MTLSLTSLVFACQGPMRNNSPQSELCTLLDGYPGNSQSIRQLPVEDLITLQKCGLHYHPHFLFESEIAESDEYPVPKVLAALRGAEDDEFRFELIEILIQIAQSGKHLDSIRKDKPEVLSTVDQAVDNMKDTDFRELGMTERQKLASVLQY